MLRILEIEILKYQTTSQIAMDNISESQNTDFDHFKSLMYTIQGFSKESPNDDSPLHQIQEEDENEEVNQIPQVKSKMNMNKD